MNFFDTSRKEFVSSRLQSFIIGAVGFLYFTLPWHPLVDPEFISIVTVLMTVIIFSGTLYIVLTKKIVLEFRFVVTVSLVFLLFIFGVSWSESISHSLVYSAIPFGILFGTLLIIGGLINTPEVSKRFLLAYLLGTLILIVGMIVSVLSDPTVGNQYSPFHVTPETLEGRLMSNNRAGLGMVLGIPISWYLNKHMETDNVKIISTYVRYYPVLAVPAILLTSSRQSFVAMLACIIVIGLYEFRINASISFNLKNTLISLFGLLILYIFSNESFRRIRTTYTDLRYVEGNVETRIDVLTNGYHLFEQKPVLGHGPGMFDYLIDTGGVNNTPIIILVEFGIVGFTIFIFFGLIIISYVARLQSEKRILWASVVLIWFLMGLLRPITRYPFLYLMLVLLVIHSNSYIRSDPSI